jgi:hypothetical protein
MSGFAPALSPRSAPHDGTSNKRAARSEFFTGMTGSARVRSDVPGGGVTSCS